MTTHIAILRQPYLQLILDGIKTVESRLTVRPLPPFGVVKTGDVIHFKQSAGPFRARAIAGRVWSAEALTAEKIQKLQRRFNRRVCGDEAYWQSKCAARFATFIELRDVTPVSAGPAFGKSHGLAWFVMGEDDDLKHRETLISTTRARRHSRAGGNPGTCSDNHGPPLDSRLRGNDDTGMKGDKKRSRRSKNPSSLDSFVILLTAGALRNRYLRVPAIMTPGEITLHLPGGVVIQTQVTGRGMIRHRGWGPWFVGLHEGDGVCFTRVKERVYQVTSMKGAASDPRQG